MAVEIHIKHGDEAAEKKDLLSAISHYTAALNESPEAYLALIKRAAVYTKLSSFAEAKSDITKAFVIAEKRGKRTDKATCHYRLGLVNYAEKDYDGAVVNFKKAQEYQSPEPGLGIWLAKAERELKKQGVVVGETSTPKPMSQLEPKSTLVETINKNAPLKVKIRDDWYQNNETVTITIYAKNIAQDTLSVEFAPRSVSVSFPSVDNSEYSYDMDPLFASINTDKSSYKVYSTKLEITLIKELPGKWAKLEGDGTTSSAPVEQLSSGALAYPSSSKKAINWSNFQVQEEEDKGGDDFFSKLYHDVDDDTKRAMMKSYVESNGTVLTTNWEEAKSKKFETSPPEGMEAHKWEH